MKINFIFILTLIVIFNCKTSLEMDKKPNIVFILADDLGYSDVGYSTYTSKIFTPYMDKLAKEGIILDNYYVQSICSPSRSQFLSGRYQIHTGLQHGIILPCQPNCLPINIPTLPNFLKQLGYQTYMVGKWHLGFHNKSCLPTNRGFDYFYGFYNGDEDYYSHEICSIINQEDTERKKKLCGFDFRNRNKIYKKYNHTYSAHLLVNKTKEFISRHRFMHLNNEKKFKPFFLYLAFQSVHAPLQVPSQYLNRYSYISDEKRKIYAGMVTCLDEAVGNITSHIQTLGLWNNTIIIFSTDNGGQIFEGGNNWPLRGWKNSYWEGGIKASSWITGSPLYLKKFGYKYKGLMHISDWLPTLVHLAEGTVGYNSILKNETTLDGFDMWKFISENKSSPRHLLLHNIDPLEPPRGESKYPSIFDIRIASAIRYKQWKLITGNAGNGSWIAPPEDISSKSIIDPDEWSTNLWLFNIYKDPIEIHNLVHKYPNIVKNLLIKLKDYENTAVQARYPPEDENCDPNLRGGVWGPWTD